MNTSFRMTTEDWRRLQEHFKAAGSNETQAFAVCANARCDAQTTYLVKHLLLPGKDDLEKQSAGAVAPTAEFQAIAYGLAWDLGLSVFDLHTHPFSEQPMLSSIDYHHGRKNAQCLGKYLPSNATSGMLVFNSTGESFHGVHWDNPAKDFLPVNTVEILGSPTLLLPTSVRTTTASNDPYARHRIIPGWRQGVLENANVMIVGLGGNGALIFQSLVALGFGTQGWLWACDPDILETSNLPRIPYATPAQIGCKKAAIAQQYAEQSAPGRNVACFGDGFETAEMQDLAKQAHLLIGAVDSHGVRKLVNRHSVSYLIPYLDIGTEIIVEEGDEFKELGQVIAVVPGQSPCLTCIGAIDASEAANELASEDVMAERQRHGYVRGTSLTPTPSVIHLNGVTSHLALSQMLRLVFGDNLVGNEFLQYDRGAGQLMSASTEWNPDCPVCGRRGYVGIGDSQSDLPAFVSLPGNGMITLVDGESRDASNDVGEEQCHNKHYHPSKKVAST